MRSPFRPTNMHTNSMLRFGVENVFFRVLHLDPQILGHTHNWDVFYVFSLLQINSVLKLQFCEYDRQVTIKVTSDEPQRRFNGPSQATNGQQERPRGAPMDPRR